GRPDRFGRRPAGALPVQLPVHLGGGEAVGRQRQAPVPGPAQRQHRADDLPVAGAQRGTAVQQERHVGPEVGGDLGELVARPPEPPQGLAGHQRGGRVGAATGEARRERDLLAQVQAYPCGHAGPLGERGGRADHQVGPVHGQPAGALALRGQAQGVAGAGGHLVVERDGVVDRLHVVVAVGSPRAHPEVEVDLGGDAYPHGGRHGRVRTLEPLLAQRLAHRRLPCAATAANCSTVSDSPRVPGSIPAARRIAAARSAPPAQAASAARSVLRRWANAAATTSNTSSRVTSVRGGSRRVNATSPDSTWGTGQNTAAGTRPAGRALAYQASFTDGTPYNRLPGAAVSRSATSRWTITSPRLSVGRTASRCSSTGTATLYGRFATRAVGCGSGRLSSRSASPVWTDRAAARAGTRAATVAGSAPASTGSISTAWTCATAGSSARVSEPSPGPTSSTTSSGARSAAATIRRTVLGSC